MSKIATFFLGIPKSLVGYTARVGYANGLDNILMFLFMYIACVGFSYIGAVPIIATVFGYLTTLGVYALLAVYSKFPGFLVFRLEYQKKPTYLRAIWISLCVLWIPNLLLMILLFSASLLTDGLSENIGLISVILFSGAVYQWAYLTVALVKIMFHDEYYIQKITKTVILEKRNR